MMKRLVQICIVAAMATTLLSILSPGSQTLTVLFPFMVIGLLIVSLIGFEAYSKDLETKEHLLRHEAASALKQLQQAERSLHDKVVSSQKIELQAATLKSDVIRLEKQLTQLKEQKLELAHIKKDTDDESLIVFLSLLQEKGRFIDFLMEDIRLITDEQIAGVARLVHAGCRDVVTTFCPVIPISKCDHGEEVEINPHMQSYHYRIPESANTSDEKVFKGRVIHPGWQIEQINLPQRKDHHKIIYPCEIVVGS